MTFSFLVAGALVLGICAWLLRKFLRAADERYRASAARQATIDGYRRRTNGLIVVAAMDRRAYFESLSGEWPFATACRMNGVEVDLLMNAAADRIRIFPSRGATTFSPSNVYELAAADITDVHLEKQIINETRKRTEDVITPRRNNKSTVGRAVAGGVLLGPLGAMVGAASSMKAPPPKIEKRTIEEKVEREGVPLIVISTRDPARPLLKLDLTQKGPAEEWHARLVGAIR